MNAHARVKGGGEEGKKRPSFSVEVCAFVPGSVLKALSSVAKDLYLVKLTVMNQEEGEVPYLYDCRFVDDLKI